MKKKIQIKIYILLFKNTKKTTYIYIYINYAYSFFLLLNIFISAVDETQKQTSPVCYCILNRVI